MIEVNPQTRIPRTFKRFAGLMGKFNTYVNKIMEKIERKKSYFIVHIKEYNEFLVQHFYRRLNEENNPV